MDILELRRYCLSLPLAEECTPFDETTLVFKIGGKMFCYTDMVESYLLVAAGITPKALRQEIRNQIEKAGLPEE